MKRIIITMVAAFIAAASWGQQATFDVLKARNVLEIPKYASLSAATAAGSRAGNLVYVYATADSGFKVRNIANTGWISIPVSGGGGSTYAPGNGIEIQGDSLIRIDSTLSLSSVLINSIAGGANVKIVSRFAGTPYVGSITLIRTIGTTPEPDSLMISPAAIHFYSPGGYVQGLFSRTINNTNKSCYLPDTSGTIPIYFKLNSSFFTSTNGGIVDFGKVRPSAGTPTDSSDSQGSEGDIMYDNNYFYIKTSSGWKRVSLDAW